MAVVYLKGAAGSVDIDIDKTLGVCAVYTPSLQCEPRYHNNSSVSIGSRRSSGRDILSNRPPPTNNAPESIRYRMLRVNSNGLKVAGFGRYLKARGLTRKAQTHNVEER